MAPASRAGATVAALAAVSLGVVAGVMMVAGHAPWEGPQVVSLSATHGIHRGDVLALVPVLVGAALGWWCFERREPHERRRGR